jgi:hypothetical protein
MIRESTGREKLLTRKLKARGEGKQVIECVLCICICIHMSTLDMSHVRIDWDGYSVNER